MSHVLHIGSDTSPQNPAEVAGWKVVSFNSRHSGYENPENYIKQVVRGTNAVAANAGLQRKLQTGNAFWLSYYEHGLCRWSMMGEGPNCEWDSVRIGGIILWDDKPEKLRKYYSTCEAKKNFAASIINQYTHYCNGSVYEWWIEDEQGFPLESVSGYYDADNSMFEAINDVLKEHDIKKVVLEGDAKWLKDFFKIEAEIVEEEENG